MPRVTPLRNFLLRIDGGKRVRAKRGVRIEVNDEEHRRLDGYFLERYRTKKSGLSVKG